VGPDIRGSAHHRPPRDRLPAGRRRRAHRGRPRQLRQL